MKNNINIHREKILIKSLKILLIIFIIICLINSINTVLTVNNYIQPENNSIMFYQKSVQEEMK